MFEISPRVYDLQVDKETMPSIKWGFYHYLVYNAKKLRKYAMNDSAPDERWEDFQKRCEKPINNHKWITRVLEHGYMHEHERLMKECEKIVKGDNTYDELD